MIGHEEVESAFGKLSKWFENARVQNMRPQDSAERIGYPTLVIETDDDSYSVLMEINHVADAMPISSRDFRTFITGLSVGRVDENRIGVYHRDVYYDERGTEMHKLGNVPVMTDL